VQIVSMFRKTVLATVVIGAGLGTMSGAAFAGDDPGDGGSSSSWGHDHHGSHHDSWHHGSSTTCSNDVNEFGKAVGGDLADVASGAQTAAPVNACHILDDNSILNHNHISLLGPAPDAPIDNPVTLPNP
jgi:hypothetical protein